MDTLFKESPMVRVTIKKARGKRRSDDWIEISGSGAQTSIFDGSDEVLAGFDRRCNVCTIEFQQDTIAVNKMPWRGWFVCDLCEVNIHDAERLVEEGNERGYGLLAKYTSEIVDNARNNRLGYGVEIIPLDELGE